MSDRKFEIPKRETLFQGYYHVDRFHIRQEKFAGGWSNVYTREIFRPGRSVGILPYDPQQDKVVIIEQFASAR